jgi:hypothetical protein
VDEALAVERVAAIGAGLPRRRPLARRGDVQNPRQVSLSADPGPARPAPVSWQ